MNPVTVVVIAVCAVVLSLVSVRIGAMAVASVEVPTGPAHGSIAPSSARAGGRHAPTHVRRPSRAAAGSISVGITAAVVAIVVTFWASTLGGASIGEVLAHGTTAGLSVVLIVIDYRWRRLPNPLVLLAAACVIGGLASALAAGASPQQFAGALLTGGVVFAVAVLLYLASRGAIGGGDVKLAGVLGVLVGWWGVEAVFVWLLLSAVLGGVLALIAMRSHGRHTSVPFGPALLVGAWAAILLQT